VQNENAMQLRYHSSCTHLFIVGQSAN